MGDIFLLDIGDWSGDGHGKKESFAFRSNKSIDQVREAYFKACEQLPDCLCPEKFFNTYQDHSLPKETWSEAKARGYDLLAGLDTSETSLEEALEWPDIGAEDMAKYTVWFIQQGDAELVLEPVSMPRFAFYGFDEQKRHIGFIGYGLLSDF